MERTRKRRKRRKRRKKENKEERGRGRVGKEEEAAMMSVV